MDLNDRLHSDKTMFNFCTLLCGNYDSTVTKISRLRTMPHLSPFSSLLTVVQQL